jgi:CRISPR/Cas system CMR-associated protein Cmr1 (group 7 of RAMP superfamily)
MALFDRLRAMEIETVMRFWFRRTSVCKEANVRRGFYVERFTLQLASDRIKKFVGHAGP